MIGKIGYLGLLVPLITFSTITSAQSSSAHIAPAGSQKAIFGAEENFTGRVRVAPLLLRIKTWPFPQLTSHSNQAPALPGTPTPPDSGLSSLPALA